MAQLKFEGLQRLITENDLLLEYGDRGRVFKTKKGAEKFKEKIKGEAYITKLVDYKSHEIRKMDNEIGRHFEDAKPYCKGYLVTIADN